MSALVVVAALVAGSLGALLRYGVTRSIGRRWPGKLTRAVLLVNVVGSFVAGVLVGAEPGVWGDLRYIVVGGFAGGLTTFSTWSTETIQLVLNRRTAAAVRNVAANLAGGLLAAILGWGLWGLSGWLITGG